MKVIINGEARDVPAGSTIARLLDDLGAPSSGVAVAWNDRVVRRAEFSTHSLTDGDRVEIIRAVAGG